MSSLLVTGGAGFIGSNFVRFWRERHPADRIVVLDALTYAGNLPNLEGIPEGDLYRFVHGDIRDTSLVERLVGESGIDIVVHFAAESHVDRSISGPDAFIETNIVGTHSLLKAVRACWLEGGRGQRTRFHHVSTDEVYGSLGPDEPAFRENTAYAPNSPYSASKAASDHLVRAYYHTYGLPVTISNCSNNYGPLHFPEKLIPLMITRILQGRRLPVYGDGTNVRDWLHVSDHCRGIELVLEKGEAGESYNIGGGAELSNMEVVRIVCEQTDTLMLARGDWRALYPAAPASCGARSFELVEYVTDRKGHDFRYAIDSRRIERELGYRASVAFLEGIRDTIVWFLENPAWWQAILRRMREST
jgi:dTDP-glucose 4,6-dehydratase